MKTKEKMITVNFRIRQSLWEKLHKYGKEFGWQCAPQNKGITMVLEDWGKENDHK